MAWDQELLTGVVYIDHSKALDILDCALLFNDITLNWCWGECSQLVTAMLEEAHGNLVLSPSLEEHHVCLGEGRGCVPSSDSTQGARTEPLA